MKTIYLKETTNDWKTDFKVPNHTYIFQGAKCIGYIKEGTTEQLLFKKPWKSFDKRGRTFEEVKCP